MQVHNIQGIEIVFLLLLLFVVVFGALARKLAVPYPIVLVIGGLLLSFVPRIPRMTLNPDLVFFVILPPLLYSAAWLTSWREFSYNLVSIFLLAFGLVTFTIVGVTEAGNWLLPGFDWRVGLVLGAIVAPTDAIAATSIARRVGLPRRMVDILEGESLLNDATALLALEFGIGLLVAGHVPTFREGALRLCYLTAAGLAIGLAVGEIVHWVEHRIDDGPIEIALSILTPYVAYLVADFVRASGVLAVVACGLYLSRKSSHFFSPTVRLQAWAVWESLTFVLNGLAFVLIGLQLPYVMGAIRDHNLVTLILYGVAFSGLLILLRLIWMFPGAYLANVIRRRMLHQRETLPPARHIFIVGWTGMRGVVSLAAAIALPRALENGTVFAQRNLIIFLAFSVILVTLVLQGLTLPPLIRALGVAGGSGSHREETEARRTILDTALSYLEKLRGKSDSETAEVCEDLAKHYRHRLATLAEEGEGAEDGINPTFYKRFNDLSRELLRVERQTAVQLRNQRRISDELLREIEREIDLGEARLLTKSS
ncbi:MAG TPA: Na+/H+ antiporter [Terriglobales bacterium]|jgi:CPA1 family monovalent cation:H+ antiporter|nr:Na+/H+ antiporter [Terriglobales bacterium]